MIELAREYELLCYGAGWRAEIRQRYASEAAMQVAAEAERRSGRYSYAEFFVHILVQEKKKRAPYWIRHKLGSEGLMQGWCRSGGMTGLLSDS
jgi:hypothetical protein